MKAMLTFDTGETIEADVYFNDDRPIYADSMERDFMRTYNRNTPPDGHKLIKVKIFRTGSVTMPPEMSRQLPPLTGMRDMNAKGKKRSVRIW